MYHSSVLSALTCQLQRQAYCCGNLTTDLESQNDGTHVSVNTVPSLQLQVQSTEYTPRPNDSSFPIFGNAKRWPVAVRQHHLR